MMRFTKEYELRAADFDCYDRLQPASVLSFFQDVAGIHANELGIGFDVLMARQTIWVLTKVRYRVVGRARRYEQVRVHTWPLPPSRVNFRREYLIETADGTPLVHGTSEWVIVHSEKRRVLPATDVYPTGKEYCTDTFFEGRLAKVPSFVPDDQGVTLVPGFTQLDINGHVNNTKYADYVMDLLCPAPEQSVSAFQIDYHRELLQGTAVKLHLQHQMDGSVLCRGISGEGEVMFSCRVELQEETE